MWSLIFQPTGWPCPQGDSRVTSTAKGKLPGLWKSRNGACIISLLPHSVDQSRSQTSSDSRGGETDSTSLGEELQSIVAILQSPRHLRKPRSISCLPARPLMIYLFFGLTPFFISSLVIPGLFLQGKEPDSFRIISTR